jgi:hypothetical protein
MGGAMGGPEVPVDELILQVSFEVVVPRALGFDHR